MKRIVSVCLTLACLLSLVPAASAAGSLSNFQRINTYENNFSDVPAEQWYAESVSAAYEFGLMKGSAADKFNPDGTVTIAEALAMACRIHDLYNGGTGEFTQGSPWYQVYVDYAVENGILTFTPESYTKTATRAEFAAILSGALPDAALKAENDVDDGMIPDVATSNSHYDAIYRLYRAGILTGNDSKGTFTPDSTIGRSSSAAIVTRMADKSLRKEITLTMDALSQDIEDSNISWYFQEGTGTLYLNGKGGFDFANEASQPWKDWRASIKEVVVSEDITEIGDYAFTGCTGLTAVHFPAGLKRIGEYAFAGCTSFGGTLDLSGTKLTEIGRDAFTTESVYGTSTACPLTGVSFPKTLKTIGANAFARNKSLTRVDLSNTKLTALEGCTFAYCSVSAVAFPETLERIEYQVFIDNRLERVVVPGSVVYIGEKAFNSTITPLKEIYFLGDELPELEPVDPSDPFLDSDAIATGTDYSQVTIYFGGSYLFKKGYHKYNIVDEYDMSGVDAGMPPYVELTGISIPSSATVYTGDTQTLTVRYSPADASDKGLTWTSSNTAVATVGSNGVVRPVAAGTAVITATASNGLTASCTVTVKSLNSADYAYLVSSDFRSIRRDYSHANALNGYAYAYKDKNGNICVLTYVQYKIGTSSKIWSEFYLHNLTTGRVHKDPADYYATLANRAYGASKINYLNLSSEVLQYQSKILRAVQSIISTGTNTENGAYVSAAILNL